MEALEARHLTSRSLSSTTGQGLDQFGAEWYVLAPSGNKIDHDS